jgi:hypothetical protein
MFVASIIEQFELGTFKGDSSGDGWIFELAIKLSH